MPVSVRSTESIPNQTTVSARGEQEPILTESSLPAVKKRGSVERILNLLCQHGASPSILIDAHPHIGTDKLPEVIENIRKQIISCGGEVRFETRMEELIVRNEEVVGLVTHTGEEVFGPVIPGHRTLSARDVYRLLDKQEFRLEPKGLAVGVRLEHPQELIDRIQYHSHPRAGSIPARCRVQLRYAGKRSGCLFVLYVSRRIRGAGCQWP